MDKPKNFDNTRAEGTYTPVALGGHRAIIKNVTETRSRTGREMIIVSIDFASEDAQPGYFADQYKNDTRQDKKWPYTGTQYILTEDNEGNTNRAFKGFCTAFEDSNGLTIKWGGANWGSQFQNRRIGVVFGEVEEEYNGEIKTRRRIRWWCDDHKALDQDIPAKRFLSGSTAAAAPQTGGEEWMQTDFSGEELPFR